MHGRAKSPRRSAQMCEAVTVSPAERVLAATVWVGGQLTLAALVPGLRAFGAEVPKAAARRFNQVAWPAFGVLVADRGVEHRRRACQGPRRLPHDAGLRRAHGGECVGRLVPRGAAGGLSRC